MTSAARTQRLENRAEGGGAPLPRVVGPVAPPTRAAVEAALRWTAIP